MVLNAPKVSEITISLLNLSKYANLFSCFLTTGSSRHRRTFVNSLTHEGESACYLAARHGHVAVVQLLLKARADINQLTNDSSCPLYAGTTGACPQVFVELDSAEFTSLPAAAVSLQRFTADTRTLWDCWSETAPRSTGPTPLPAGPVFIKLFMKYELSSHPLTRSTGK